MTQKITDVELEIPALTKLLPSDDGRRIVDLIEKTLADVKQDSTSISIALQVQDITAQKIAAANHLIECVRVELLRELNYFEHAEIQALERDQMLRTAGANAANTGNFDKNASYEKSTEHQDRINKLMKEWKEKKSAETA